MSRTVIGALIVGAVALGATAAYAAAQPTQNQQTPKGWSWTPGKDGSRVERPSNVTRNPDGSTREVIPSGNCQVVKEKSATGEYRQYTECKKPN